MNPLMPICPRCSRASLRPHCESPTCDLIFCQPCDAYGTRDGQRWRIKTHDKPKPL